MRVRLSLVALGFAVFGLVACGQENGSPLSPNGEDIQFVDVHHQDGSEYRCLYVYRDGGYDGGPAMWCERVSDSGS